MRTDGTSPAARKARWRTRQKIAPYIFISPFFVLFAVFMLYPVIFSFIASFHEWNGMAPMEPAGWTNYVEAVQDTIFTGSFRNSLILFFEYVPAMTLLALILAVLLNKTWLKGRTIFRAFIFIPYVTSTVAMAFVFQLLLDRDFGLLNLILSWLGIKPIGWLQSVFLARISLCLLIVWQWLGYNMVLLLAGLQNIPEELEESALIDGANQAQSFIHITIPLMSPMLVFCLTLSTIGTFGLFTEPLILTNGGPVNATITPMIYLYRNSFNYLKFGYGSALAYLFFLVIFVLTLIEQKLFRRGDVTG